MHTEQRSVIDSDTSLAMEPFPERYAESNVIEGRAVYEGLLKRGVLDADSDFGSVYFGWFKSKNDFAYLKLYGSNNICAIPGMDYKDYANELFDKNEEFVFVDGHVFWK